MEMKQFFLAQLEREEAATRKVVDRVPEGRNDWKPHPKSMELGKLAALVATMPGWLVLMIERDELDLDDPASEKFRTKPLASQAELRQALAGAVTGAREALRRASEEHLLKPWRFKMSGRVLSEQPRHVMIADTFCHLAHHRGQLTVYLRLNDASVPAVYGPSADEQF